MYKNLISKSNDIRKISRRKNDPAKDRKALETYVELRGYKQHDNQWSDQNGLTLDEIAKQLGTSKTNLKQTLRIERNLTDSMKELLDTVEINIASPN